MLVQVCFVKESGSVVAKVAESCRKLSEMPRRRCNVRKVESFDSKSSGSASDAGEASDGQVQQADSPVERPIDTSMVLMDVDDCCGAVSGVIAVEGTVFSPRLSRGRWGHRSCCNPTAHLGAQPSATQEAISASQMPTLLVESDL